MNRKITLLPYFLPTLLSVAVATMGITVMIGWLFRVALLVEINPGSVAIAFNTALCFAMTGIALALPGLIGRPTPKLQMLTGIFIFILSALLLVENIFDTNLAIDWAFLHHWFDDGNTRPGRIAPNTAIGFILIGAMLVLKHKVKSKKTALMIPLLTIGVLIFGLTGLVGYFMAPDLLFGWVVSARMAIPTALAMIVVAIVFWLDIYHADWYQSNLYFQEDEKITFIAAAILLAVTLTAGLIGFAYQQGILENTLKENLYAILKSRVGLFNTVINQAVNNSENASKVLARRSLPLSKKLSWSNKNYESELSNLLGNGIHGVALYDLDGRKLGSAGVLAHKPEIVADLHSTVPTEILWNHDLYVQSIVPVVEQGVVVARLLTEQPINSLRQQLFDLDGLGKSDEVLLCKRSGTGLLCFPNGIHHSVIVYTPKGPRASRRRLPMYYALAGQSGVIAASDYREKSIVAAYASLAPGLGLVVKEDTKELYSVIRDQLKAVVPVLLFLVGISILILRSQLKPLTTRVLLSERLSQEKELEIGAVVGNIGEGILTISDAGMITSFNAAASIIFGFREEEIIGKQITILMPSNMRDLHNQGISRYLQSGDPHVIGKQGVELPGLRKNGDIFQLELTISDINLPHRRLFVGIVRDITERKKIENNLVFLAQHDGLTGLLNRTFFMDRLSAALRRAQRNQTGVNVFFLDLDEFKQINDTLGHQSGDDLLKQIADRLQKLIRKTDTVARLGGDEFTIILEGLDSPLKAAEAVAKKIITILQEPFRLGSKEVIVTASIGVAVYSEGESNEDELLTRADHAMYKAKKSGKNQWFIDMPNNGK